MSKRKAEEEISKPEKVKKQKVPLGTLDKKFTSGGKEQEIEDTSLPRGNLSNFYPDVNPFKIPRASKVIPWAKPWDVEQIVPFYIRHTKEKIGNAKNRAVSNMERVKGPEKAKRQIKKIENMYEAHMDDLDRLKETYENTYNNPQRPPDFPHPDTHSKIDLVKQATRYRKFGKDQLAIAHDDFNIFNKKSTSIKELKKTYKNREKKK